MLGGKLKHGAKRGRKHDVRKIGIMLKKFNYKPLNRVHGAAHDVIIGCWANWWLKNTKGTVLNPASKAFKKGSRKGPIADILFARPSGKIAGVCEVENTAAYFQSKATSLKKYEQCGRFGNLEFVILSTFAWTNEKGGYARVKPKSAEDTLGYNKAAIKRVKDYSKKSKLIWVIHILKWVKKFPIEYDFKEYGSKATREHSCNGREWLVFYEGKELRHCVEGISEEIHKCPMLKRAR